MKVASVIGTRPQYVKAAIVTRALRDDKRLDEITIDTGQHYDDELSALLLDDLTDLHRAHNLDIHEDDDDVGDVLDRMVDAVTCVLVEERPDAVIVYGDTNSTVAGAHAASALDIPIAHVEAGLRSYNPAMREERNRVLVDGLSQLLLCPTTAAVSNLAREGLTAGVHHVGDVMYDSALLARQVVEHQRSDLLERLGVTPGGYAIATLHRAETTDDVAVLGEAIAALRRVAETMPVVFPVHPRTSEAIAAAGLNTDGLIAMPPVGYFDMTRLLVDATIVYTDSGGLQKEAYFHRVPCVTLRSETEWVETIDAGWNRLWTVPEWKVPRRDIPDYGDGHAGRAIVDVLAAVTHPPRPVA